MILITGITGGIGNYLSGKFIKDGEDVTGTYHTHKPEGNYANVSVQLDIKDNNAVQSFVQNNISKLKNITLINCAGISQNAFAHKANVEEWKEVIDVNLTGTFQLIHALLPIMREQNFGRIINLSSILAQTGVMGTSAYAASKAGLNGMIKSIALENAQKNITINNINLGYFNVGMINTVPDDVQQKIKSKIAMNSFGEPENIYSTVKYIRETPYLTGVCIDLNGGLV